MSFWTWAKGNEDTFDGNNRRNLRQLLSLDPSSSSEKRSTRPPSAANEVEDDLELETELVEKMSLYLQMDDKKIELPRIPTCAVFHKMSSGKGVPHTFSGFIKQWPALPRVVVRLIWWPHLSGVSEHAY